MVLGQRLLVAQHPIFGYPILQLVGGALVAAGGEGRESPRARFLVGCWSGSTGGATTQRSLRCSRRGSPPQSFERRATGRQHWECMRDNTRRRSTTLTFLQTPSAAARRIRHLTVTCWQRSSHTSLPPILR